MVGDVISHIGPLPSSYLEGILLILVRRPYEIGDSIAVSDVDQETAKDGSNGWIVENIDLFTTTVRFGMTREVATLWNGSLARSRIINMKRSDQAQVIINLKFGVNEPFQKIKVFRKAVEQFVKDRVQEWIEMSAFRSTRVEADLGYIEYVVVLRHRESWQQVSLVLESKAAVSRCVIRKMKGFPSCLKFSHRVSFMFLASVLSCKSNLVCATLPLPCP